jgi:O-antigen/teichoic acid export membrane protein
MRDLLRTFELIYGAIGLLVGLLLAGLAPYIADYWVTARQLPPPTVERAFVIMGIAIACQWPVSLYSGGLSGLQHQVLLNALTATVATVRNVGAAIVLWQFSSTIETFLIWQAAVSFLHTLVAGVAIWHSLPKGRRVSRFELNLLREVWRFAAGMTGISVMAVVLTQLDKIILSKVLSLEAFGYYSLAWRVALGIYYLVGPINAAFFPRFSQLVAQSDQQQLARLYHRSCQLMSVVVIPVTVILAMFAGEVLLLWTMNATIAAESQIMMALLVTGTAINGLMTLPLSLQLAHGRTRLVFLTNTVAVVLLAPLIYVMSLRYGGVGAAWVWILLNCGYVLFLLQMMHRDVLPGHLRGWYFIDVGLPLAAAASVAGSWRFLFGLSGPYGWMLFNLAVVSVLTALAAALATPLTRGMLVRHLSGAADHRAET